MGNAERVAKSVALRGKRHRDQLETYLELIHEWGHSDEEAAARMGVHLRTVQRYRSELGLTGPNPVPVADIRRTLGIPEPFQ